MSKIIRKYFLLFVVIIILFVVLGIFINNYVANSLRTQNQKEMLPPVFLAKMLDNIKASDKVEAIQKMESWNPEVYGPMLFLLDENGRVLYTREKSDVEQFPQPERLKGIANTYDYLSLKNEIQHPPKPLFPFHFLMELSGGPPQPPPRMRGDIVIKLAGTPNHYLWIAHQNRMRPPPGEFNPILPWLGIGSLIISLFIGIGVTIFIIYNSVHKKIKEADDVISQIQSGNLKARFKIQRRDEFGEAMVRFNKMADEIEKLVDHLKFVELARTKLIQELAHDLRTPISSLKNILETLHDKGAQLEPVVYKELMDISIRETEYFARLVEDLLLLSQVSEPKYGAENKAVDLVELINDEIGNYSLWSKTNRIYFEKTNASGEFRILGNHHLLSRMVRNILENATSFAKSSIHISITNQENGIQIQIEDDGPGFSEDQIKSYGIRKLSREVIATPNDNSRLSIGLGSVIIKKIVELHQGSVTASNSLNEQGHVCGGVITINLST